MPPVSDWAVVALTSAAVFAALAALFATSVWWDFGVSLDLAPWRVGQECALAGAVVRGCSVAPADAAVRAEGDCAADRVGCSSVHFSPALTCPFYPEEPATQQCIACGTVVSKLGMHFEARRESGAVFPRPVDQSVLLRPLMPASQNRLFSYGEIILDPGRAMRARAGRQAHALRQCAS
jgi:hypothetical protein